MHNFFPRVIHLCLYREPQAPNPKNPEGPIGPEPHQLKPQPQKPNLRPQTKKLEPQTTINVQNKKKL